MCKGGEIAHSEEQRLHDSGNWNRPHLESSTKAMDA